MRSKLFYIFTLFIFQLFYGQEQEVLTFEEYLGYVKKYHPIVKQGNLKLSEAEAKLLKARGAFDPKLEVDYDRKLFQDKTYYNKLNATFKIPIWYGINFKSGYQLNSGNYLNPEYKVPENGLYNVGVSVSLAKGLLMNERMATLKQAKLYQKQAEVENQILINDILLNASQAYFLWIKTYQELLVYTSFLDNAKSRFAAVKRSFELGDKPAIDTIEVKITLNKRLLQLEKAKLNHTKARLQLSNYLWIEQIPLEIKPTVIPEDNIDTTLNKPYLLQENLMALNVENNPKIQSLQYKYQGLQIEKKLKKNNLLPQVDLHYNFITTTPNPLDYLSPENYKTGLKVRFPLFLRKERADLQLMDYQIQSVDFDIQASKLIFENKLKSIQQEIDSYQHQIEITKQIVSDYTTMLKGEERKFEIGESTLFLLNYRESSLIENKLKQIELYNQLRMTKGKYLYMLNLL